MSALVLIHAFPLDHRMYDEIVNPIAEAGWDIFTPDLRGFGGASDFDEDPNLAQCARDIAAMLDRFGVEKAVIGGTSLGGYVALNFLRNFPERVAALILIDTKAAADAPEGIANRVRVAEQVLATDSSEAFCRSMLPNVVGATTNQQRPAVLDQVRAIMADARALGVANMQIAMAHRLDSFDVLQSFRGPVLSIRGEEDTIATAADHQQIVDACRDAVAVEIAACGHLAPLEAPAETTAAILQFLKALQDGTC